MTAVLRFYGYGACSTCRRALTWLSDRGIAAEVIDITTDPPGLDLLAEALVQLGDRRRLFNTSGKRYREIGSERIKAMEDQTALEALAADGRLIKRPFLVTASGRILTGFKEPEWLQLFSS
ncbi:MAG: Spx/MgsR family RNA polymerase-binding regulatory protein [Cyanobacteriota bacterium]